MLATEVDFVMMFLAYGQYCFFRIFIYTIKIN